MFVSNSNFRISKSIKKKNDWKFAWKQSKRMRADLSTLAVAKTATSHKACNHKSIKTATTIGPQESYKQFNENIKQKSLLLQSQMQ